MTIRRHLAHLAQFDRRSPAQRLSGRLPRLLVLSDDARGFIIEKQLAAWPHGAAFIERTFGKTVQTNAKKPDAPLRLATCSPRQARKANIDGVHWPEKRLKFRRASAVTRLIETTSAHRGLAIAKAARLGIKTILVSTAFASNSPSATRPLGALRLAKLQRMFPNIRLYGLGGVTSSTIKSIWRTGIYGVALVSFKSS